MIWWKILLIHSFLFFFFFLFLFSFFLFSFFSFSFTNPSVPFPMIPITFNPFHDDVFNLECVLEHSILPLVAPRPDFFFFPPFPFFVTQFLETNQQFLERENQNSWKWSMIALGLIQFLEVKGDSWKWELPFSWNHHAISKKRWMNCWFKSFKTSMIKIFFLLSFFFLLFFPFLLSSSFFSLFLVVLPPWLRFVVSLWLLEMEPVERLASSLSSQRENSQRYKRNFRLFFILSFLLSSFLSFLFLILHSFFF